MREVADQITHWLQKGEDVALATVVATWGSAPRGTGAKMAFTASGNIAGSVSGGCVEGAVIEEGEEVLSSGQPRLLQFGVSDESAWDVGLACGGQIEVYVEKVERMQFAALQEQLRAGRSFVTLTVITGPNEVLGRKALLSGKGDILQAAPLFGDDVIKEIIAPSMARGSSSKAEAVVAGQIVDLFIDVVTSPLTLIMVGGVHIAVALSTMARAAGFRTIVVDPRRAFGNAERFPDVDQLIQAWPAEAFAKIQITSTTAVAILTHDPKIDDPALKQVVQGPAFYIGALGSANTHAARRQRLLDAGVAATQLDRIHGPIGLDINAQTPEEIAVSILAEIVKVRHD